LCLNALAKSRNSPPIQSFGEINAGTPGARGGVPVQDSISDPSSSPEQESLSKELGEKIMEAVGKLSPEHRLVFIMTEYHGLSYQEVASVIQCPVGTVASRKNTAVRQLRKRLAPLRG
jgi:RNA polymerase sigma-70 factor (ECF subfamily)